MKIRRTNAFLIILIVAALSLGNSEAAPTMYAHFINVGQADTCPYRKFHPGMKISHEHCVLARSTQ